MRKLFLTMTLAGLVCLPVVAQFPFGNLMRGSADGNALLTSKDIQKELKLTDDQVKSITESRDAMMTAMRAAFQDGDQDAIRKAQEDQSKTLTKLRAGFTPEQKKRFFQLELQSAAKTNTSAIFAREDVQKAMSFTEKQKEAVKTSLTEMEKDVKELFEDAQGDREKMRGMMTKMTELNKDTFGKITKTLSEEQKKTWKEIQGEAFKGEFTTNPFGKAKKKKDDF